MLPHEVQEFMGELRAFTKPTWRGWFRSRYWMARRWLGQFLPKRKYEQFPVGTVLSLNGKAVRVKSVDGPNTITVDDGSTITF